jgi:hypothetical protein
MVPVKIKDWQDIRPDTGIRLFMYPVSGRISGQSNPVSGRISKKAGLSSQISVASLIMTTGTGNL